MRTVALILLIAVSAGSYAQRNKLPEEIELKGFVYHNEWSVGARLLSNGWEVFGERAKFRNIHKTRIIQFGFSEIKHWKERKQENEFSYIGATDDPKNFYYGKQNHFFTLRAGYGFRKIIADKAEKNGVRFSITYLGGITIGLLKPYYLELLYQVELNDSIDYYTPLTQRYSEKNHDVFMDRNLIFGASGFKYGLTEIEPVPGVYGKFGFNFDWASKEEFVKALEGGVMVDIYYKKVPIMVSDDNRFFHIAAYISFQFGKRW